MIITLSFIVVTDCYVLGHFEVERDKGQDWILKILAFIFVSDVFSDFLINILHFRPIASIDCCTSYLKHLYQFMVVEAKVQFNNTEGRNNSLLLLFFLFLCQTAIDDFLHISNEQILHIETFRKLVSLFITGSSVIFQVIFILFIEV